MKSLKKFFKLLPAFALAFMGGLGAVLNYDQAPKTAYADDLLLWNSSFDTQTSGSYNVIYQDNILNPISFRFTNITVNLYDSYVGNSIVRVLNYQFDLGPTMVTLPNVSYVHCDISIPNVPIVDFSFKFELTDFKFLEKKRDGSSTFPHMSNLVWSASIHFNFYITSNYGNTWSLLQSENIVQNNVVVRNNNASWNSYDLTTAYVGGLESDPGVIAGTSSYNPYVFAPALAITEEGIQTNQYNNGYRAGYSAGSDDGFNNGYSSGEKTGYSNGYTAGVESQQPNIDNARTDGYNSGYADGYNEGFSTDSTVATIFSGILQVGALPINILLAIFNFEILGINLSAFISAIFTVCLTVIIIRSIKGGGSSD